VVQLARIGTGRSIALGAAIVAQAGSG